MNETITWIPVGERLPEREGLYRATFKGSAFKYLLYEFKRGKWWSTYIPGQEQLPPSHWSELPKGPSQ